MVFRSAGRSRRGPDCSVAPGSQGARTEVWPGVRGLPAPDLVLRRDTGHPLQRVRTIELAEDRLGKTEPLYRPVHVLDFIRCGEVLPVTLKVALPRLDALGYVIAGYPAVVGRVQDPVLIL